MCLHRPASHLELAGERGVWVERVVGRSGGIADGECAREQLVVVERAPGRRGERLLEKIGVI